MNANVSANAAAILSRPKLVFWARMLVTYAGLAVGAMVVSEFERWVLEPVPPGFDPTRFSMECLAFALLGAAYLIVVAVWLLLDSESADENAPRLHRDWPYHRAYDALVRKWNAGAVLVAFAAFLFIRLDLVIRLLSPIF